MKRGERRGKEGTDEGLRREKGGYRKRGEMRGSDGRVSCVCP